VTPAERIVLALRRQGWSRTKLGRALGISQASASALTHGRYPGTHHFPRIAKVLDVPLEWLRTGYPEPPWVPAMLLNAAPAAEVTEPQPATERRGRGSRAGTGKATTSRSAASGSSARGGRAKAAAQASSATPEAHAATTQTAALMRRLREVEHERNQLQDQVRRLESTAAWQATRIRELQSQRRQRPAPKDA
jgi:transcriptional regulator with XRE-family HTH domain